MIKDHFTIRLTAINANALARQRRRFSMKKLSKMRLLGLAMAFALCATGAAMPAFANG